MTAIELLQEMHPVVTVVVSSLESGLRGYYAKDPDARGYHTVLVLHDDRKRPLLYACCRTPEQAVQAVLDKVKAVESAMEARRESRRRSKDQRAAVDFSAADSIVKPGSVFYRSWGYDQTNVDFYVVVSVTPKTVVLQACGSRDVGVDDKLAMATYVVPAPEKLGDESFRATAVDYRSVRHDGKTYQLTDLTTRHYMSWYA